MHKKLTAYLSTLEADGFGKWIVDTESRGTVDAPVQMPYVSYSDMTRSFISDVYSFIENHPEKGLNNYQLILEQNNIKWEKQPMQDVDVSKLDEKGVLALIFGAVRAERFCDGALLSFFKNGQISKWLMKLKEIDEA